MRKAILIACLLCLPPLVGCKLCATILEALSFDSPPKHHDTPADRQKTWEWENRQFQN